MTSLRPIEIVLAVLVPACFAAGVAVDAIDPMLLVLAIAGVVGYLVIRSVRLPETRTSASRTHGVRGAVEPMPVSVPMTAAPERSVSRKGIDLALLPPERECVREPVAFSVIARAIEDAGFGFVRREGDRTLQVRTRAGEWCQLTSTSTEVTRSTLQLEASSGDIAALACDAIAPKIGALVLRAEGVELPVDGTLPVADLQRKLFEARIARKLALTRELRELEDAKKPESQPSARLFLN